MIEACGSILLDSSLACFPPYTPFHAMEKFNIWNVSTLYCNTNSISFVICHASSGMLSMLMFQRNCVKTIKCYVTCGTQIRLQYHIQQTAYLYHRLFELKRLKIMMKMEYRMQKLQYPIALNFCHANFVSLTSLSVK